MTELLVYIVLYALYAATLCFLFVMLFIRDFRRWWLRAATAVFGLAALGLPFTLATRTLGYPDPWPVPGRYDVFGWDVEERSGAIFLFVQPAGAAVPYHMRVPFELGTALKLQSVAENPGIYKQITVDILAERSEAGPHYVFNIEKVFSDDETGG